MKSQALVDELVGLGIYSVDYEKECTNPKEVMSMSDSNNTMREVKDNGITDEEAKFLLSAKQTSYLKTIKGVAVFYATLTSIAIVLWFIYFIVIPVLIK